MSRRLRLTPLASSLLALGLAASAWAQGSPLSANRPEPFTTRTQFTVTLARDANVEIGVFDITGRLVTSLQSGTLAAGAHEFTWRGMSSDGAKASAGVYFVRAASGGAVATRKVVLASG